MPDVILSNDDITVLGPPETVELLVDIGPTGERGSKFFVGTGEPNALTSNQTIFSEEIYLYDMYINAAPGTDYGYMYQYVSEPGGNTWSQVLKISPTLYSKNHTATFTSGEGSITVPIANIVTVSGTPLTASNFNIQYSIESVNPLASSIEVPALAGAGTNLVINFNAVKSVSGTWSNLTGEVKIHLFISLVV
jgi:hypothetical protein